MQTTLDEQTVLLTMDESGNYVDQQKTGFATAGGVLLELALAGRITMEGKKVAVSDPTPLGVAALDTRLEAINTRKRPMGPHHWVWEFKDKAREQALEGLRDKGIVQREERKALGLFSTQHHRKVDNAEETELRRRLTQVVVEGAEPDDRTAALAILLHSAGLQKHVFPDVKPKDLERRMEQLAEGDWAGPAVRKALDSLQYALIGLLTTAVVAGTPNN